MIAVGLSATPPDAGCCLVRDGRLIAAAQESWLARDATRSAFPLRAFTWCLRRAGVAVSDVSLVAEAQNPRDALSRQIWTLSQLSTRRVSRDLPALDGGRMERDVRERLGFEGPILRLDRHLALARGSLSLSGFTDAAVLVLDASVADGHPQGGWISTAYAMARDSHLALCDLVCFPDAIGWLHEALARYLGCARDGADTLTLLAADGQPRFVDPVRHLVSSGPRGQYRLSLDYFDLLDDGPLFTDLLPALLGRPPRDPNESWSEFHRDVARSVQVVLQELLADKARFLARESGSAQLALAGAPELLATVGLSPFTPTPFSEVFVPAVSHTALAALGAAALAVEQVAPSPSASRIAVPHGTGPSWSSADVATLLAGTAIDCVDGRTDPDAMRQVVAQLLASGKTVGWCVGALDIGHDARLVRAVLADARDASARRRINVDVLRRDASLPLPAVLLASAAADAVSLAPASHASASDRRLCLLDTPDRFPAIARADGSAHVLSLDAPVDGTAYAAAPLAALLSVFHASTGCPLLAAVPFASPPEPLICSPTDALLAFGRAPLDALVLESFLIVRPAVTPAWLQLLEHLGRVFIDGPLHTGCRPCVVI